MIQQNVFRLLPPFKCGDDETLMAWQRKATDAARKQKVPYAVAPMVRIPHPTEQGFVLVQGDEVRPEWFRDPRQFDRLVRNGSILRAESPDPGPQAA